MTFEEIYNEADEYYGSFEQEYGIYMSMELDLSYVWHYIEMNMSAGVEPEEVLETVKQMISGAADMAEMVRSGEAEYD